MQTTTLDKLKLIAYPIGKNRQSGVTLIDQDDYARVSKMGIWSIDNSNGYVVKFVTDKKTKVTRKLYLHRFIMNLKFGDGLIADHYDGDPLNNSKSNLRIVTPAENSQNRVNVVGGSVFRGVSYDSKNQSWTGRVRTQGYDWSKSFSNEWDAAKETNLQRLIAMPFAKPDPYVMARLYEEDDTEMLTKISKFVKIPK